MDEKSGGGGGGGGGLGNEIQNFGGPFLEHYYYTLSLSDLCLGEEKKDFHGINLLSLYNFYGHTLAQGP